MTRLAVAVLFAVVAWLPTVSAPPIASAAVCTGWSSTTTPPPAIRVLRTSGVVETVDFKTYVKVVMAAEWPSTWPLETMRAGAVAAKQYAWYYTRVYRGITGVGGCADIRDNSNDQIYTPSKYIPAARHIQAVDSTWSESITKNGAFILTSYGPGSWVTCGYDADGYHLRQQSAYNCATDGKKGEEILAVYYGPGVAIVEPPTVPGPPVSVSAVGFDSSALVTWVAPALDGNSPITGYVATAAPGGNTCTTTGALTCWIDGLTNGSSYTFTVTAANSVGSGPPSDPSASVTPAPPTPAPYVPLAPTRILDTRTGTGLSGAFSSHVARTFQVSGGIVPANATAVTGNLTVTGQTSAGFLYIGPRPMNNPTSSNLNFPRADDRANAVTVALGATGSLSITFAAPTLGPSAQVIFDVTGYFTPEGGATYTPLTPTRLLDTRTGTGLSGAFSSHVARTLQVSGGIVPTTATAVTANLTVTGQTSAGFLYVGPAPVDDPTSSNLNFPLGDDRANAVTVALGPGGTLGLTYAAGTLGPTAQVIFDVTGYFSPDTAGTTYTPLAPTRLLDTRTGTGLSGAFSSHVAGTLQVNGGLVPTTATAVTGNLTVTGQTSAGFLYLGPVAANDPTSSTLNFPLADDRANAVTVALGAGGTLSITFAAGTLGPTAHVIFDVTGYFAP